MLDRYCIRPQVHRNQYDDSYVSYAGFTARSYVVEVILDSFWYSVSGQKMAKKDEERRGSICM